MIGQFSEPKYIHVIKARLDEDIHKCGISQSKADAANISITVNR